MLMAGLQQRDIPFRFLLHVFRLPSSLRRICRPLNDLNNGGNFSCRTTLEPLPHALGGVGERHNFPGVPDKFPPRSRTLRFASPRHQHMPPTVSEARARTPVMCSKARVSRISILFSTMSPIPVPLGR